MADLASGGDNGDLFKNYGTPIRWQNKCMVSIEGKLRDLHMVLTEHHSRGFGDADVSKQLSDLKMPCTQTGRRYSVIWEAESC